MQGNISGLSYLKNPPKAQHACFISDGLAPPGRNFIRKFKSHNSQRQQLMFPCSSHILEFHNFRKYLGDTSPNNSEWLFLTLCMRRELEGGESVWKKSKVFPYQLSPNSNAEAYIGLSRAQTQHSFLPPASLPLECRLKPSLPEFTITQVMVETWKRRCLRLTKIAGGAQTTISWAQGSHRQDLWTVSSLSTIGVEERTIHPAGLCSFCTWQVWACSSLPSLILLSPRGSLM